MIVGPESVCGSSRMKGGSVTKIMLETIFSLAIAKKYPHTIQLAKKIDSPSPSEGSLVPRVLFSSVDMFKLYKEVMESTYDYLLDHKAPIRFINNAGNSIKTGGHVYYIGFNSFGTRHSILILISFRSHGGNRRLRNV